MIHSYLLANSGVAKVLSENSENPVTLEELLMAYCETSERFVHVVELLEKLPQFEIESLKTSNCLIDETLPYDSLIGLSKSDLETLYELIDYLDLPRNLYEKLRKVIDKEINWKPYTMKEFVENGDLRGIKYLHEEKGVPLDINICVTAAANGHLECLKYAFEQNLSTHKVSDLSAWCKAQLEYTKICVGAALNGHLECLKYAHEQGCSLTQLTCTYAAVKGHFECLKYAHEQGCPWNEWTCRYAALGGKLECLKYAFEHGCPWDKETCSYAAKNGHLACLKYAHNEGCPWNESTCVNAAANGHLECLKYAHTPDGDPSRGCPWDKDTCLKYAATPEIYKWIEEN